MSPESAAEIELVNCIHEALGTNTPATTAYRLAFEIDMDEEGKQPIDFLNFFEHLGQEIPPEFSEYIEVVDGETKADRHMKAMARRGAEQVIYDALAEGDSQ